MKVGIVLLLLSSMNVFGFTMGQAIDEAGRQRMLSQKVAKAYFMQAINANSSAARYQMQSSVDRFEHNLRQLKAFVPAAPLRSQLALVEGLWIEYKRVLQLPINEANADRVMALSNQVLSEANKYVKALQDISATKAAELINISGRQRMLSQRMTKQFLASYWQGENVTANSGFYLDIAEFENALLYLLQSAENTPLITKKLMRVKGQLEYANHAFDGGINVSGDRIIFMVTGTTDLMLYQMNEITGLYSQLLAE